ncbi:hypothetical protein ANO11243_068050 [Dothideomycetidae sp. 11243]|nr:hypothetical protein ANO11243_068050 [fungal sp. No.11243]
MATRHTPSGPTICQPSLLPEVTKSADSSVLEPIIAPTPKRFWPGFHLSWDPVTTGDMMESHPQSLPSDTPEPTYLALPGYGAVSQGHHNPLEILEPPIDAESIYIMPQSTRQALQRCCVPLLSNHRPREPASSSVLQSQNGRALDSRRMYATDGLSSAGTGRGGTCKKLSHAMLRNLHETMKIIGPRVFDLQALVLAHQSSLNSLRDIQQILSDLLARVERVENREAAVLDEQTSAIDLVPTPYGRERLPSGTLASHHYRSQKQILPANSDKVREAIASQNSSAGVIWRPVNAAKANWGCKKRHRTNEECPLEAPGAKKARDGRLHNLSGSDSA